MKPPYIPIEAPFSDQQRMWINGFLAGLNSKKPTTNLKAHSSLDANTKKLSVLYGTQTGNAEDLASDAAVLARKSGYSVTVEELDSIEMETLADLQNAIVVVSTYGEGEMPDNAQIFWDKLSADTAPRLDNLSFAVLALGDTSYDEFCEAGKLIDTRFEQLGASRLIQRIDCDVDYEDFASDWLDRTIQKLPKATPSEISNGIIEKESAGVETAVVKWNRKNPFNGLVKTNALLSKDGSSKEIRHVVFDLGDSGIAYESGDALGVMPKNCPALVESIVDWLGVSGDLKLDGSMSSVRETLSSKLEIMTPSRELIHEIEKLAKNDELSAAVGNKKLLEAYLWGRDTFDLLSLIPPATVDLNKFLSWLKPLQHRAYSISSSPKAHPNEIHLTVAAVRWERSQRQHKGVASTFLADLAYVGESAGIFLTSNKSFRVPKDDTKPMIMVGPGTGVAPFRAFLQERESRGSTGMNWLFFGDQHRGCDFLYEDELAGFSKRGILTRLDLAFSRDQKNKIYVQDRMAENGRLLFEALEDGGHFYVCGDASRMARDVDTALHTLIAEHGKLSTEEAVDYVNNLKKEKRYLRDVY